jgi:hypothetical protein
MNSKNEELIVWEEDYPSSEGRLLLEKSGAIIFERKPCPYRIILRPGQVSFEKKGDMGVVITRKDCPSGCPQTIWDEGFEELDLLLNSKPRRDIWNLDRDGEELNISHHRFPYPNYPLRTFILTLGIKAQLRNDEKNLRWILTFYYSNDVTKDKYMSIVLDGAYGVFHEGLIKEGGGYFEMKGKTMSWTTSESPVLG